MSQTHVDPKVQDKTTKEIRRDLQLAMKECLEDNSNTLEKIWKVQLLSAELIKWIML